jgi:hypothetical protein
MKAKKIICVEVENKHLDALEDLLTAELTTEQKVKAKKLAMKLWVRLVKAYDKE